MGLLSETTLSANATVVDEEVLREIQSGLMVVSLILYLLIGHWQHVNHYHFPHESGVAIGLGLASGVVAVILNPAEKSQYKWDDSAFFVILLPPIIFCAGYTLKKRKFVKNLGRIATYGLAGTLVSFSTLSLLIAALVADPALGADIFLPVGSAAGAGAGVGGGGHANGSSNGSNNSSGGPPASALQRHSSVVANFSLRGTLQLGSILSATDTVAVLSLLDKDAVPTLYSSLFGEGVVNDAMSIVLYKVCGTPTST
jgi:NhaP-type Na+/H+ or K+/H+ antiporter